MEEGEAIAWLVFAGCKRILGQCIFQSFQLGLRHVAGDGAVTEVLDNFWLETLINGAEVVALAILEFKRALISRRCLYCRTRLLRSHDSCNL